MAKLDRMRSGWKRQAEEFGDSKEIIARPIDEEMRNRMIHDIKIKLKLDKKDSLLDVGCGDASTLESLMNHVEKVVGVDFSEKMVEHSKKRIPKARFKVGLAWDLPFKDDSFDKILCYSVFHYFPDISMSYKAIDELIRVCKSGGIILIGDLPQKTNLPLFERILNEYIKLKYRFKRKITEINPIHDRNEWLSFDLSELLEYVNQKNVFGKILSQTNLIASSRRKDILISC